jgi:hypothetical protein
MQAFWMGGAASVPAAATAGPRSMLAFWMGGAAAGAVVAVRRRIVGLMS